MQKKNLLRLLALVMTLTMAFALALPVLAETDDEIAAIAEEEIVEEEVVEEEVIEEEPEEIEIPEFAWTKYFLVPVFAKMDAEAAPIKEFKAYTRVKVVEPGEVWTKIEYGVWFNNLDGLGNQIMWIPAYIQSAHLTYEAPVFESLYNVYVAK